MRATTSRLIAQSIAAHRLRSALTALGIAIGITAVVLLTSIGEGVHRFVLAEFTQFGTNNARGQPGQDEHARHSPGVLNSVRPLTLEDAEALTRVPHVLHVVPVVQGNASVEGNGRERTRHVYRRRARLRPAFSSTSRSARSCRPTTRARAALAVLGSKVHRESCSRPATRSASGSASAASATG